MARIRYPDLSQVNDDSRMLRNNINDQSIARSQLKSNVELEDNNLKWSSKNYLATSPYFTKYFKPEPAAIFLNRDTQQPGNLLNAKLVRFFDNDALCYVEVMPEFWMNMKLPASKLLEVNAKIGSDFVWDMNSSKAIPSMNPIEIETVNGDDLQEVEPTFEEILEISKKLELEIFELSKTHQMQKVQD